MQDIAQMRRNLGRFSASEVHLLDVMSQNE